MKRLLCIGDSNTYGYDPRSYFGSRYPETVRWTGLLAAQGYACINDGINGRCIPRDAFSSLGTVRENLPLDALLVMLGTNDLLGGADAAACGMRMEAFLRGLLSENLLPAGHILLIAPPALSAGSWTDKASIAASQALGPVYKSLAERLGTAFADAGLWEIPLCFDGVHFSPEGHARFADCLLSVLERLPA